MPSWHMLSNEDCGCSAVPGTPPRGKASGEEWYVMHTRCDWRHHTVHVVTANQIVAAAKAKDHFSFVHTFKAWCQIFLRARSKIAHFFQKLQSSYTLKKKKGGGGGGGGLGDENNRWRRRNHHLLLPRVRRPGNLNQMFGVFAWKSYVDITLTYMKGNVDNNVKLQWYQWVHHISCNYRVYPLDGSKTDFEPRFEWFLMKEKWEKSRWVRSKCFNDTSNSNFIYLFG